MYLTGLVMMDDGAPPPEAVTIEISCGGKARPYGVTDSVGAFTVNYGQPDSYGLGDAAYSGQSAGGGSGSGLGRQGSANPMVGCELTARLPGFRADPVQLSERRQLDSPNLGSIILHRLTNVSGYTFSMTTMNAPKHAQKEYEKGIETARKSKWPESESRFRKALAEYPKYAICWEALGRTLEVQEQIQEAQKAYQAAVEADPRFVTPYLRLMVLFGRGQRWEDAAKQAATVIQLDPSSYPIAYYFNGIANMSLKRDDVAEKNVRDGLKVDSRGSVPRLDHLMGTLLMARKAYGEAIPYLRAYLQSQPQSADAASVRGSIVYAERMGAVTGSDTVQQ